MFESFRHTFNANEANPFSFLEIRSGDIMLFSELRNCGLKWA